MRDEQHAPVNGFNHADVKSFLAKDAGFKAYKPTEVSGSRGTNSTGAAKGTS